MKIDCVTSVECGQRHLEQNSSIHSFFPPLKAGSHICPDIAWISRSDLLHGCLFVSVKIVFFSFFLSFILSFCSISFYHLFFLSVVFFFFVCALFLSFYFFPSFLFIVLSFFCSVFFLSVFLFHSFFLFFSLFISLFLSFLIFIHISTRIPPRHRGQNKK